ncbi:hypothetical protein ACKLNO_05155 [Neisseriaceae bacterium B1]
MDKKQLRALAKTLILIGLVFALSSGYGSGFMAFFPFLIWLVYTFFNVFSIVKSKQWRLFAVCFVAWCVLWASLYFIHQHHAKIMREQANHMVQQIEQYHTQHGEYPPRNQLNLPPKIMYWRGDTPETKHEAHLIYRDNVMLFDDHIYDFKHKKWEYRPD